MSIFKKKEKKVELAQTENTAGTQLETPKQSNAESIEDESISSKKDSLMNSKQKTSAKEKDKKKNKLEKKESRKRNKKGLFSGRKKAKKISKKPISETLVSLDYGSRDVKLVHGKTQGGKIKIQNCISIPMAKNWYRNGSIENYQHGQDVLSELLIKNNINTKNVVCTIESNNIVKREIIVPRIDEADMDSLLQYEMGQYLPIDPSEYIIQYIEIDNFIEEDVEKLRLLVAVVPKAIVEGMLNFLNGMKVTPFAMDEHSNSLKKLIEFNRGYINNDFVLDKTVVLIDMGNEKTDVIVFKDGSYQFNTILDFGYSDFKQIVSNGLGLAEEELHKKTSELLNQMLNKHYEEFKLRNQESEIDEEVEAEKQQRNIYENINYYFMQSLLNKMELFIGEIDRSIKYYTMQNQSNKIDKIYLYGGGALEADMTAFIEEKLEITTDHLEYMDCVELVNGDSQNLSKYWNAIGAMIRL